MQFNVIAIDFDFETEDDAITDEQKTRITNSVLAGIWEACDGEDLIEEITSYTGWCINSIEYVLSELL